MKPCFVQGHWLGCLFFALAAYHGFDSSRFRMNWVDAWVQQTYVRYSWQYSSAVYDYVVCIPMYLDHAAEALFQCGCTATRIHDWRLCTCHQQCLTAHALVCHISN